jgi:hypothetical protein
MFHPMVKGTIFAANTPHNCATMTINDKGFNISTDASCGTSHDNTDPLLDPAGLANNGGPTQTIALQMGSPAIDLMTPVANCTDVNGTALLTDQRLYGRPDPTNPNACDSGAYEADAVAPFVLVPGSERLQIARSSTPNSDQVNMGLTFIENGTPDCTMDEDALNSGFGLSLFEGTCASIPNLGLTLFLDPFVVRTVNHQSYGTLYQTAPPDILQQASETVSARLVALSTPMGSCGEWTLNLEVAGLNTAALGLGGSNPFALVLNDPSGDGQTCFDITNAIVGNQIDPPTHSARREVRRQRRRGRR